MPADSPTRDRPTSEAVHGYFGLTYANYLVLHRSLMQSMPDDWQERFVALMDEYDDHWRGMAPDVWSYLVKPRGEGGRFLPDPIPHYNRGRTFVEAAR